MVADDLMAWLTGLLADAGRRKLTTLVFGTEQERALQSAARSAIRSTAAELCPDDSEHAEAVAAAINQVFREPMSANPLLSHATLLEALQAGIAAQLAVLDDADITGTGESSAAVLGVRGTAAAAKLTSHLMREIVSRGAAGGPLFPLASQLNDDVTHLQGQRIHGALRQLRAEILDALARMESSHPDGATAIDSGRAPDERLFDLAADPDRVDRYYGTG